MDDLYNSIFVASLDGQQSIEFSGLSREMSLKRFKSLVAIRVQRLERKNVNAADLELTAFGEIMADGDRSLASYGIQDDAVIHRVDRASSINRPRSMNPMTAAANEAQPPPYTHGQADQPGRVVKSVFVKDAGQTYTLNDVSLNSTVEAFFSRLQEEKQLPKGSIRVIFGGKELAEGRGRTLEDYNVQSDSTMHIVVSLPGGMTGFYRSGCL